MLRLVLLFISILAIACSSGDPTLILYVGTYTGNGSDGIYAYRFDPSIGSITPIGLAAKTENPSFIAIDPTGNFLYAVNEIDSFQQAPSGAVSVFSINRESGKLDLLQQVPSLGASPAHLSLDKYARNLLVANYNGGNVSVFPIKDNGTLATHQTFIQDAGSGPNIDRQAGPHAHFISTTPDNRFVMVADLGIDKVLVYRFDSNTGSLIPSDNGDIGLKPGDGPRHIAFAPAGNMIYILNELTSTIASFSWDERTGMISPFETLSTLPKTFSELNTTAEILIDQQGNFLYASNRGHDSIVIFSIGADGRLFPVEWVPTGGKGPRHFEIDPTGKWLFASNQNSNDVNLFKVDQTNGRLTRTNKSLKLSAPVCIKFLPMKQNPK